MSQQKSRQIKCEWCGTEGTIEGHHPDHLKPFFLLYLCKPCHLQADVEPDRYEDIATDYTGCIV